MSLEVVSIEPGASASIQVEAKSGVEKKPLPIPNFSQDDVAAVQNLRVPPGEIQLKISWNGLDKDFNKYPTGTSAAIIVDGIPTGYEVFPGGSTNIYVSSVVHRISIQAILGVRESPLSWAAHSTIFPPTLGDVGSNLLVGEPRLPPTSDPHLNCQGSGEITGDHPGWSSTSAIKLTVVAIDAQSYGVYWCPAAAPYGSGPISYTMTATPDAITCETVKTFCLLDQPYDGKNFTIMATDKTGSYSNNVSVIPNSGLIETCANFVNWCNVNPVFEKYSDFGNSAPELLGDCTFAAIADWEEALFGIARSSHQIIKEYKSAVGNSNSELTNDQVFSYWKRFGIGDTYLDAAIPHPLDPVTMKQLLDSSQTRELIAQIRLSAGDSFAGYQIADGGYHWIDIDGYSPKGPVIITWGQILQMTWQQWNLDAQNLWSLTIK